MAIYETTIKSSKIYVGDICYGLADDYYYGGWQDMDFADGIVMNGNEAVAVVAGTAHGDGEYYSDYSRIFPVDAGNIGVVGMDYAPADGPSFKDYIFDVPSGYASVYVEEDEGIITIEIVDEGSGRRIFSDSIDTDPIYDDNEDEEEDDDYYDDEDEDEEEDY